jgi:hypothetical protein
VELASTMDMHGPEPLAQRRAAQARHWSRARALRGSFFDWSLFVDPAWTLMLDVYTARLEGRSVSLAAACEEAGVPTRTALLWIGALVKSGFLHPLEDQDDKRLVTLRLTDAATETMNRMMDDLASG